MEAAHGMTLSGAAFLVKAKQLTADQSLQESLMEDGFEDNTNPEAGSLFLEAVRLLNLSEFSKYLPTCGVGTAGCAQDTNMQEMPVCRVYIINVDICMPPTRQLLLLLPTVLHWQYYLNDLPARALVITHKTPDPPVPQDARELLQHYICAGPIAGPSHPQCIAE